jgi:hypothetical protein
VKKGSALLGSASGSLASTGVATSTSSTQDATRSPPFLPPPSVAPWIGNGCVKRSRDIFIDASKTLPSSSNAEDDRSGKAARGETSPSTPSNSKPESVSTLAPDLELARDIHRIVARHEKLRNALNAEQVANTRLKTEFAGQIVVMATSKDESSNMEKERDTALSDAKVAKDVAEKQSQVQQTVINALQSEKEAMEIDRVSALKERDIALTKVEYLEDEAKKQKERYLCVVQEKKAKEDQFHAKVEEAKKERDAALEERNMAKEEADKEAIRAQELGAEVFSVIKRLETTRAKLKDAEGKAKAADQVENDRTADQARIVDLESQLLALQGIKARHLAAVRDVENIRLQRNTARQQHEMTAAVNNRLTDQLKTMTASRDADKNQLEHYRIELQRLQTASKDLNRVYAQHATLRETNQHLLADNSRLTNDLVAVTSDLKHSKEKLAVQREITAGVTTERQEMETRLTQERNSLKARLERELRYVGGELDGALGNVKEMEAKIKELKANYHDRLIELYGARARIKILERDNGMSAGDDKSWISGKIDEQNVLIDLSMED